MSWKAMLLAVAVAVGMTIPSSADALTINKRMATSELVSQADTILTGQVSSLQGFKSSSRGEIFTRVKIEIYEQFKGEILTAPTVDLRLPGGEFEDEIEVVIGSPCFVEGEDVLLFLSKNAEDTFEVVGMAEGKFTLTRDPDTGEQLAVNAPSGVFQLVNDEANESLRTVPAEAEAIPLRDLLQDIRRLTNDSLALR